MDLALIPWGTVTPGMLVALGVIALIRGDLRTHREVRDILENSAREIGALAKERDDWKATAMTLLQATLANTEAAQTIRHILEGIEKRTGETP